MIRPLQKRWVSEDCPMTLTWFMAIALASILAIIIRYKNENLYWIFKPLPVIFMLLLFSTNLALKETISITYVLIGLGLFFGLLGDLFLLRKDFFLAGLISFLVGHILYVVSFTLFAKTLNSAMVIVTIALSTAVGFILPILRLR